MTIDREENMSSADDRRRKQQEILTLVSGCLPEGTGVSALGDFGEEMLLHIDSPSSMELNEAQINELLGRAGYHAAWVKKPDSALLRIRTPRSKSIPWKNIIMFALTCVSVFFVPQCTQYQMQAALADSQKRESVSRAASCTSLRREQRWWN